MIKNNYIILIISNEPDVPSVQIVRYTILKYAEDRFNRLKDSKKYSNITFFQNNPRKIIEYYS